MTPRQLASAVSVGLFIALVGLLSALPAHAAFFTYSQWAAFSEAQRDAYVAGAVDALEVSVLDKNDFDSAIGSSSRQWHRPPRRLAARLGRPVIA
jgi:hypothetical protein